jgi:hypothetical protein
MWRHIEAIYKAFGKAIFLLRLAERASPWIRVS